MYPDRKVAFLALLALMSACFAWGQSSPGEEHGTLGWHLSRAKAEGRTEVDLGTWVGIPPEISSADEALSAYTTVVVQPIAGKTYVEQKARLVTWYKVRILDIFGRASFSRQSPAGLSTLPADIMPTDLLPLAPDELLILQPGGTTAIDGITVSSRVKEFPPFSVLSRYICFLDMDPGGQWATVPMLGAGAFEIVGESIRAVGNPDHPVVRELRSRFDNSLRSFRDHARQRALAK